MKVKTITIGRLFNLGSYEHIRYDVSVELEEGDDAGKTFAALASLIRDLNPKSKVEDWSFQHAKQMLVKEADPTEKAKYEKMIITRTYEKERRKIAAEALSNLGGSSYYKDAKNDWEQENEF